MADNGSSKGDDALLVALASGATVRDAAGRAGVAERTAYRRLDDPGFRRRLARARAELIDRAVGQLSDAATAAVATLRGLLDADSDNVKLGAARSILELGTRLREAAEIEGRLVELESTVLALTRKQHGGTGNGQENRPAFTESETGGRGAD